jgi:hypothetical protein
MTKQGDIAKEVGNVQGARPHSESVPREVKATPTGRSPREVFDQAMASPDLTHKERVALRCAWLAVAAQDDACRAAEPQAVLALDIAA